MGPCFCIAICRGLLGRDTACVETALVFLKFGWFFLFVSLLFSALLNSPIICYLMRFFTALHGMQTRYSDEKAVRLSVSPSVCLSVRQTRELWQNGRKICPAFILYERSFSLVFWEEEWLVGGGDPFYPNFLVNRHTLERNRRFWTNIRS